MRVNALACDLSCDSSDSCAQACLGEPEKRPPSQLVGGLLRAVVSGQQRRSDWSGMLVSCRLLLAVEPFDRITDRVMQAQLLLRVSSTCAQLATVEAQWQVAHDAEGALNDLKLVAKSEWKDSVELRELYSEAQEQIVQQQVEYSAALTDCDTKPMCAGRGDQECRATVQRKRERGSQAAGRPDCAALQVRLPRSDNRMGHCVPGAYTLLWCCG